MYRYIYTYKYYIYLPLPTPSLGVRGALFARLDHSRLRARDRELLRPQRQVRLGERPQDAARQGVLLLRER